MSGANIKRLMDPEILAAIMDSATDGFTYTDETGYIVYNNRAYSEMTGLPDEKIQGHNIHQLVKEGFPISRMIWRCSRAGKPAPNSSSTRPTPSGFSSSPSPLSTARTDDSAARWATCGT